VSLEMKLYDKLNVDAMAQDITGSIGNCQMHR
jgi:hypothetical protein